MVRLERILLSVRFHRVLDILRKFDTVTGGQVFALPPQTKEVHVSDYILYAALTTIENEQQFNCTTTLGNLFLRRHFVTLFIA